MQISHTTPRSLGFSRLLRSPWLRPLNDPTAWDQLLSAINPMWSTRDFPARVLRIIDETSDTKTFELQPVRRWPTHQAGQHVVVEVEVNGRRLQRSFSLSSPPNGGIVSITVKRQPGARVSGWMHTQVRVGDVLRLSAPAGDFGVAPGAAPLLMLSAGSGITPLMAILSELHAQRDPRAIVFIHACRRPADLIFGARLFELAKQWPNLDLRVHYSAQQGRFNALSLAAQIVDFHRYQTLVCGPRALTDDIDNLYQSVAAAQNLRSESYSGRVLPRSAASALSHPVRVTNTKQLFTASARISLLEAAEAAGLQPAHGCRIGICKTCQCTKRSGSVENLRTGEISSEPNELIQLCVSVARSPLELTL